MAENDAAFVEVLDQLAARFPEAGGEVVYLRGQITRLAVFLMANFRDDYGYGEEDCSKTAVEVAILLLGELLEYRGGSLRLHALRMAKLEKIEKLTAELMLKLEGEPDGKK